MILSISSTVLLFRIKGGSKMAKFFKSRGFQIALKILLTLLALSVGIILGGIISLALFFSMYWEILSMSVLFVIPLAIPLIWLKKRKPYLIAYSCFVLIFCIALGMNFGLKKYDESITVNTSPNINVNEYLPFKEDSKIVKFENASLKLTENLPKIDGAAAVFPVYSAFVHAVYPDTTVLATHQSFEDPSEGVFQYNNTYEGYISLAEKKTDIFFGAYPSKSQIEYAEEQGTHFKYIPIGSEAFVFFVHKDNPIDSLTTEQIKAIYSGQITNWKEVGGNNEKIRAFQREKNSGSQTAMENLVMGGTDACLYEAVCEYIYRYSPFLVDTSLLLCTHGTNERIPVAALEDAVRFFKLYIRTLSAE